MPEDLRTPDPVFSLESASHPAATALGALEGDTSAAAPARPEGGPAPIGAGPVEEPRVEVTCGGCRRGLRVRASYLGRFVVCQHCGQRFLARSDADGAEEGGSAGRPARAAAPPTHPWPRDGLPAQEPGGLEKLAARIEREFRLARSRLGPRDDFEAGGVVRPGPGLPARPRGPSEDRLRGERDSALADVARLEAELDELRPRVSELEARLSALPVPADLPSGAGRGEGDAGRGGPSPAEEMAARVGILEGEIDRLRGELDEATARRAEDRAAHSEAIRRAIREEGSRAEAEREALRDQLDRLRAHAAEEVAGLVARAEELRRERDSSLARCGELEQRGRDLEDRLNTLEREARSAAEEAGRLHRDEVGRLSLELGRARDREEAARGEVASLGGQVEGLRAALELASERSEADRRAMEGDRDGRLARLSGELAEARGREDADASRIASLEARVEELQAALGRESGRLEAESRAWAARLEEVERQAGLDRSGREGEIAALRRGLEEAEKGRDAEGARAAGLGRGADELAARLAIAEPALADLRRLEAEVARLSAELAASRAEAALGPRQGVPPPGPHAEAPGSGPREAATASPPPDGPHRSPLADASRHVGDPGIEAAAEIGPVGRPDSGRALREDPGRTAPASAEIASATPADVPGPGAGASTASDPARSPAASGRRREPGREPSIVLRGVGKEYRRDKFRIPVLEGLDLSVDPGEFLALMGPSGSGKTTLLNLIAGLDQATAGSVVVHGQELAGLSEAGLTRWRASNVGFVFQMYNLIPVMTALRNVELPLLLTRLSRRRRRENALTALRIVGLEGREDHYPRQLSGGQEQRVSIARAIVTDPHLIVADEPTGDLDRRSAAEILDLLGSLNREFHKTIVMVTHDPLAAQRATRTLHLDKGRLVGDTVQPRIWSAP